MPFGPPPEHYRGSPQKCRLEPGTRLWRVQARDFEACSFNPRPADRLYGGGRFDCTADDWYPYLYAGLIEETALAETLLRDLCFPDGNRKRTLPYAKVAAKKLHELELTTALELISLRSAADLAAIRQEDWWLIEAKGNEYAFTRNWAHWLRRVAPWAQGMIWSSRRDLGKAALVLFGDRCPQGALEPVRPPGRSLGDDDGLRFLNERLAPYQVRVCRARPGAVGSASSQGSASSAPQSG